MNPVNYSVLGAELLSAARGRRSSQMLSRRLGFTSDVVRRWEGRTRTPTLAQALRLLGSVGVDVDHALDRFDGRTSALARSAGTAGSDVHARAWLDGIVGDAPLARIARACDVSRFALSRALSGGSKAKLDLALSVVDAATGRVDDLIALLVDPRRVPSILHRWERSLKLRRLAYEHPLAEGVLAVLELGAATTREMAHALGTSASAVGSTLNTLVELGVAHREGKRWRAAVGDRHVDMRLDDDAFTQRKRTWLAESSRRVGPDSHLAYLVFSASSRARERVLRILADAYEEARTVVREDSDAATHAEIMVVCFTPLRTGPSTTGRRFSPDSG